MIKMLLRRHYSLVSFAVMPVSILWVISCFRTFSHPMIFIGDVWNVQPAPVDHPWRTMKNPLGGGNGMTPHYSGTTLDAQVVVVQQFFTIERQKTLQDTVADSSSTDSSNDFAFEVERISSNIRDLPLASFYHLRRESQDLLGGNEDLCERTS